MPVEITADSSRSARLMYRGMRQSSHSQLDVDLVSPQNDAVIAPAEGPLASSATRTILIVDDDRSVADTFARMLKLEGFNVATALNAEAGLELADSVRPDAIILDMRMPITNGLQFLRLVRSKPHLVEVPDCDRHRRLFPSRTAADRDQVPGRLDPVQAACGSKI